MTGSLAISPLASIDWAIIIVYCIGITTIGLLFKERASGSIQNFFVSGRKLTWWLAGTSLVATSFASDTPLLITGLVRRKGIYGNWDWWFMALASVASLFFFARLWRRAKVITDLEFIELRYGLGFASVLRGFKAILIGVLFNCYAMGAWPVQGLSKVLEVMTGWEKGWAVLFCGLLALTYSIFSGLWGVVATDFIQFILAMTGSIILASFAMVATLKATGGWAGFHTTLLDNNHLSFIPPHTADNFWNSPFIYFLMIILIQWWARGIEGDGVQVQRLSACKNEKHSFFAMLWYNVAHYALRPWPWIIVAVCSLILIPQISDPEKAYPLMIMTLLPVGLKGFILSAFFAAFMSTVDTHLNWGSSYLVNDLYCRFRPNESANHYVIVSRIVTVFLMGGAIYVALSTSSIVETFYFTLELFAGIGLLGVARWFWWRVNVWSEIAAMLSSGTLALTSSLIEQFFGWPQTRTINILIVVTGSTVVWVLVTLLTKPAPQNILIDFYKRIRPIGPGWRPIAKLVEPEPPKDRLRDMLLGWFFGVIFVMSLTFAIGKIVLGLWAYGLIYSGVSLLSLWVLTKIISKLKW